MYSFFVDFHDGAIRITVWERCGWLRRFLTGQEDRVVAETYLARGQAIKLGGKILNVANSIGRVVTEHASVRD